ncbi:hypothetical protein HT594_00049 [Phenacoccus solenopsis nudivirus]|nr:hypothetical protein HT594_00049 [Phenacoccus solenopsis nudivirus]
MTFKQLTNNASTTQTMIVTFTKPSTGLVVFCNTIAIVYVFDEVDVKKVSVYICIDSVCLPRVYNFKAVQFDELKRVFADILVDA